MSGPPGVTPLGVVAFAVVLGACSKQAPRPIDPNQDPAARAAIEKLESFRAQVCACQDARCSLNTAGAQAKWLATSYGEVVFSTEQRRARDAAARAFEECFAAGTGGTDAAAAAILEISALRDAMCACKDAACADAVQARFEGLSDRHKGILASEAQIKQAGQIAEAYGTCAAALYDAAP